MTNQDMVMISGQDLETMDVTTLSEKVDYLKIYSRVSPEHKLEDCTGSEEERTYSRYDW